MIYNNTNLNYYPASQFPEILRKAVNDVSAITLAPIPLISASALAAASTLAQTSSDVVHPILQKPIPLSLFFLTIADSGERKTAADAFFLEPFKQFEKQRHSEYEKNSTKYETEILIHKAKIKNLEKELSRAFRKKENTQDIEKELEKQHLSKPAQPKFGAIVLSDATPEALQINLMTNNKTAIMSSNEASMMFRRRVIPNSSILNQLWDGQTIEVDRADSSKSFRIEGARLSLCLAMQSGAFSKIKDDPDENLRDSGFFARCLIAKPFSNAGMRRVNYQQQENQKYIDLDSYKNHIKHILQKEFFPQPESPARQQLKLDDNAYRIWAGFANAVESQQNSNVGLLSEMKDFASKAAEHTLRMAGIFKIFSNQNDLLINSDHMESAVSVIQWYINEFNRIFVHGPKELKIFENSTKLLSFMRRKSMFNGVLRAVRFERRYLMQYGPKCIRNTASLTEALNYLINAQLIQQCSMVANFSAGQETYYLTAALTPLAPENYLLQPAY